MKNKSSRNPHELSFYHTCIKRPLNFGRFGFLPVSENNGNSAQFGTFLPDLNFFCQVLFPHVEFLPASHQITQPSAIPACKSTNKSVSYNQLDCQLLLYKAGGDMNVTTMNIFRCDLRFANTPSFGHRVFLHHLSIPLIEKQFDTPCSDVEPGLMKKKWIHQVC